MSYHKVNAERRPQVRQPELTLTPAGNLESPIHRPIHHATRYTTMQPNAEFPKMLTVMMPGEQGRLAT